ncbi:hypothetical protein PHYBOEH_010021 [Phytophthora boehmeriae]|uniref:FYVE-type domain-containing protein n=1 Tax=Phytophthora boehmeriae TaxID=109152 RepID=A0A8T1VQ06_9STRA|nr:hypothetical protein PHYBOEH_010021 [Phytophthora boehmeriae]
MRIHRNKATKSPDFKSPFAPLQLAHEDESQLEAVARLFVQNTVVQFEKFIEADCRKVDSNYWKCIKHERELRVFLQRRKKDVEKRMRRRARLRSFRNRGSETSEVSDLESCRPSIASRQSSCSSVSSAYSSRRGGSFTSNYSSTSSDNRGTPVNANSDIATRASTILGVELPVLQLVGSIPGSLDDAMYGSLSTTSDAMRVKSAYEQESITDGAVLATIVIPSSSDPFRSLTIKWIELEGPTLDHHRYHPLHYPVKLPGASSREDLIFLEATGMTQLASGERVGYILRHSVHFPQTLVRPSVRRGNMSTCTLFREGNATPDELCDGPSRGSVEVFARACLNGGNAAVRATSQAMVTTGNVVLCGRMKKLAWMLSQRQPPQAQMQLLGDVTQRSSLAGLTRSLPARKGRHGSLTVTVSAAAAAATTPNDSKLCVTCKKRGPWFSTSSNKKKPTTTCQLCWRYVCSSCRLKKTVVSCVTAPRRDERIGTHLVQREVTLCNVCVHHSMVATSSQQVAREEIEADPKRWRFPSPTRDRDSRSSEMHLHDSFSTISSMRGAGALRPIPIPTMSMRTMNDLFQPCA